MRFKLWWHVQWHKRRNKTQFRFWNRGQRCVRQHFAVCVAQDALYQVLTAVANLCQDWIRFKKKGLLVQLAKRGTTHLTESICAPSYCGAGR